MAKKQQKKVCITSTYRIVCDAGGTNSLPQASQQLGISISSPASGSTVANPVTANGQVINNGEAVVTVYVTDQWGIPPTERSLGRTITEIGRLLFRRSLRGRNIL
jgi:hypothetical protein